MPEVCSLLCAETGATASIEDDHSEAKLCLFVHILTVSTLICYGISLDYKGGVVDWWIAGGGGVSSKQLQ